MDILVSLPVILVTLSPNLEKHQSSSKGQSDLGLPCEISNSIYHFCYEFLTEQNRPLDAFGSRNGKLALWESNYS